MKAVLRLDRKAVSPVVAEILLVAIAVVLAAVLYIMASGLLTTPGTDHPLITFTGDYPNGQGNLTITVGGTSLSVSYSSYKFNLMVENVTGVAAYLGASGVPVSMLVGSTTYKVTYTDFGGNGEFTMGDTIVIGGNGLPLAHNLHFTFVLIWAADGSNLQQRAWQT